MHVNVVLKTKTSLSHYSSVAILFSSDVLSSYNCGSVLFSLRVLEIPGSVPVQKCDFQLFPVG